MATPLQLFPEGSLIGAGHVNKPHGIKGELSVSLDEDATGDSDEALRPGQCVVMEVDGLKVPFFVGSARRRGTCAWLVKLDGIDDEAHARAFTLKPMWLLANDVEALSPAGDDDGDAGEDPDGEGFYLSDLIGFTITTPEGQTVGTIADYDDSTANVLFIVTLPDGAGEALVPAADDYIAAISPEARSIVMDLPDGLLP